MVVTEIKLGNFKVTCQSHPCISSLVTIIYMYMDNLLYMYMHIPFIRVDKKTIVCTYNNCNTVQITSNLTLTRA